MRITYQGSGRFEVDDEVLEPGESAEVSDDRGTELAGRFPGIIVIASAGAATPDDPGTDPADPETPEHPLDPVVPEED